MKEGNVIVSVESFFKQKPSYESMQALDGDPLENAIAERVNGIFKDGYLSHYQIQNIQQAKRELNKAIKLYNEQRPHITRN